jgi:hypothetical protein
MEYWNFDTVVFLMQYKAGMFFILIMIYIHSMIQKLFSATK